MFYHNPTTNQYAKLLYVDEQDIVWLLIDGKSEQMDYEYFITSFVSLCLENPKTST